MTTYHVDEIEIDGCVLKTPAAVDKFISQLRKARNTIWPKTKPASSEVKK